MYRYSSLRTAYTDLTEQSADELIGKSKLQIMHRFGIANDLSQIFSFEAVQSLQLQQKEDKFSN